MWVKYLVYHILSLLHWPMHDPIVGLMLVLEPSHPDSHWLWGKRESGIYCFMVDESVMCMWPTFSTVALTLITEMDLSSKGTYYCNKYNHEALSL